MWVEVGANPGYQVAMITLFIALFLSSAHAQESSAALEWKPNLKWSGDMRYRLVRAQEKSDDERKYQQIRARLGLRADVNESVQVRLRLATHTSPISANQVLGDSSDPGMPRRSFGVDVAYIDWKFLAHGSAWAGRTSNPFWSPHKTQLAWDADLVFEGVSLRWDREWSNSGMFFNVGSSMISENYYSATTAADGKDSVDTGLAGAQVGYFWKGEAWSLTAHLANYHFLNVQNANITRFDKSAKLDVHSNPFERYRGNSVHAEDPSVALASRKYLFDNEFTLVETGFEFKRKTGWGEWVVFADYLQNTAIGDLNKGYEAGVGGKLGKFSLTVAHLQRESDSVLGAFTDSDANGGGTDNAGVRATFGWEAAKNVGFAIHHFVAKRGIDTMERDYSSTFVDLQASF